MEISEAGCAELSRLVRHMMAARDTDTRLTLFRQFRTHALSYIEQARNHAESQAIRVYIDRLERLSPDGEPWLAIFEALHKTLVDEDATGACEAV